VEVAAPQVARRNGGKMPTRRESADALPLLLSVCLPLSVSICLLGAALLAELHGQNLGAGPIGVGAAWRDDSRAHDFDLLGAADDEAAQKTH